MPAVSRTIRPLVSPVQYPRRDGVTVPQAMAGELGISEARCHALLYRWPRLLDVLPVAARAYHAAGDLRGLVRLQHAVQFALEPVQRRTPALVTATQAADSQTETTLAAFLSAPSRATAEAHVRALDKQQLAAATFRATLVAEFGL